MYSKNNILLVQKNINHFVQPPKIIIRNTQVKINEKNKTFNILILNCI